ncbi:MAG: hypothetical protein U0840_17765 [Gemmataceae bacterium]
MSRMWLILPLGVAIGLTGCGAHRTSNYVAQKPYTCNRCLETPQPPPRTLPPGPVGPPPGAAAPLPPGPGAVMPPASTPSPAPANPSVEGGSATFTPPSGNDPAPPPPPASLGRPSAPSSPPPSSGNLSEAPPGPSETTQPPRADVSPPPAATPPSGEYPPPPRDETPSKDVVTLPPSDAPSADPTQPDIRLGTPGPSRRSAALPPERATKEPPLANVPGKAREPEAPETPQAIDLPGFALATTGVYTGIKPFPDGITWLADRGFKHVLHLRGPGDDTTAIRRLFEARGLKYTSLEVSPARLNQATYEQFARLVRDANLQPLYVFDKDGSAAGALWFLYNRIALAQTDEKARAEAQRLGLRIDDDAEHKAMLLAAQKLLSTMKP